MVLKVFFWMFCLACERRERGQRKNYHEYQDKKKNSSMPNSLLFKNSLLALEEN